MYYYKLFMGNGYCGCDETYLLKTETKLTDEDFKGYIDDYYTYSDGFWGFDDDWELEWDSYDDFWDGYIQTILDDSYYAEISKAEFDALAEDDYRVIEE